MLTKLTGLLGLAAALIAALALTGSAHAGSTDGALAIVPQTSTPVTGEPFQVDVQLTAPTNGLGSWDLTVTFDPAVASFDNCNPSHASNTQCGETSPGSGVVRIAGFSASPLTGTQVLGTLHFTAAGAGGSSTNLALATTVFDDGTETAVTPALTDGVVNVQNPTPSPSPSPTPSPTPSASAAPTASAGASATPTITPAGLPTTGGSDSTSLGILTWVTLAVGLAVTLGGAWALSRARR